jgi:hypothetical protein
VHIQSSILFSNKNMFNYIIYKNIDGKNMEKVSHINIIDLVRSRKLGKIGA